MSHAVWPCWITKREEWKANNLLWHLPLWYDCAGKQHFLTSWISLSTVNATSWHTSCTLFYLSALSNNFCTCFGVVTHSRCNLYHTHVNHIICDISDEWDPQIIGSNAQEWTQGLKTPLLLQDKCHLLRKSSPPLWYLSRPLYLPSPPV